MESWNIEEVCDFLVRHEFEKEVVGVFRQNKISGNLLGLLSEPDMKELGLNALGDRKRLQILIKNEVEGSNELLQNQSIDTQPEGTSKSETMSLVGYSSVATYI